MSTAASRAGRSEVTSEQIDRGRRLLAHYSQGPHAIAPHHAGSTYGFAITAAIRDLLALAENHGWRFDVEANLIGRVMFHVEDLTAANDAA